MKLLLIIVLLSASFISISQAVVQDGGIMYLNKNEGADAGSNKKRGYYVGPHVLGDTITMLLNKFENEYTYYQEASSGAYAVEEKIIIKPGIYRAVRKVNKYYEKKYAKGEISEANAYNRLKTVLQQGIKLKDYYTDDVELKLKKMKQPQDMEAYLVSIKFR